MQASLCLATKAVAVAVALAATVVLSQLQEALAALEEAALAAMAVMLHFRSIPHQVVAAVVVAA
jgi:hypothetical protein